MLQDRKIKISFDCSKCGACCSNLHHFHGFYDFLDRGDGVCKHFDIKSKLCSIYEDRPEMCRIEHGYAFFQSKLSYGEYIKQTKQICIWLQSVKV